MSGREYPKLTIRSSFAAYLLSMALLGAPGAVFGAAVALLAHEAAHLIAGRCVGERFEGIEITPFGGVITQQNMGAWGWRGALVAAAGPLGNYAVLLALTAPALQRALGVELARQAMLANAVMMLFNLLPALPLDGGRIMLCVGRGALGVSRMIRVLSDLGAVLGAALACLSMFGFACWGVLNLSALIVGGYLIVCAVRGRAALLAQNLCAVVRERCARPTAVRRMQLFDAPAQARLLSLLDPMERCEAAGFVVREGETARFVSEEAVCTALLSDPLSTVGALAKLNGQNLDAKNANYS